MFAFVLVEKNIDWFSKLLEYKLPGTREQPEDESGEADPRLKRINPRQVVGTVLALNGFRLYFCMYHPKHAPSMVGFRTRQLGQGSRMSGTGSWLGFAEDLGTSSGEEEQRREEAEIFRRKKCLKTEELLEGLPNWLERLFEGDSAIRRYYIAEWPAIR